jgi:hypothetical protein
MKARVKVQPTGLLNGEAWPEAGETVNLPDSVAKDMIGSGDLEEIKAPAKKAEKKVEKAVALTAKVETRKKS